MQGFYGLAGLLGEKELGLVEVLISLAVLVEDLVLLLEGEQGLAKLADLGALGIDCFS